MKGCRHGAVQNDTNQSSAARIGHPRSLKSLAVNETTVADNRVVAPTGQTNNGFIELHKTINNRNVETTSRVIRFSSKTTHYPQPLKKSTAGSHVTRKPSPNIALPSRA